MMPQFLKDWFNTSEGWAFALGALWAVGANLHWFPATLQLPGLPGEIGPGTLIVFGVFPLLAKAGQQGATPFRPMKGAGPTTIALLFALVALALFAFPHATLAADPPANGAWKRFSGGVTAQAMVYDHDDGRARSSGFVPQAFVTYSATQTMSLGSSEEGDLARHLGMFRAGGRLAVRGAAPGDRLALYLGADFVRYHGAGAEDLAHRSSWAAAVRAAWVALADSKERARLYLAAGVDYDVNNGEKFYRLGVRAPGFGGSR